MPEEGGEEGVVPSGSFDFAFDGALVGVGAQGIEGEFAQDGEVLGGVVRAAARGVLVEVDIEHPVELVLDGLMGAGDVEHVPSTSLRPGASRWLMTNRFSAAQILTRCSGIVRRTRA